MDADSALGFITDVAPDMAEHVRLVRLAARAVSEARVWGRANHAAKRGPYCLQSRSCARWNHSVFVLSAS